MAKKSQLCVNAKFIDLTKHGRLLSAIVLTGITESDIHTAYTYFPVCRARKTVNKWAWQAVQLVFDAVLVRATSERSD